MTMNKNSSISRSLVIGCVSLTVAACSLPSSLVHRPENKTTPAQYGELGTQDTTNSAAMKWEEFFTDPYLRALIDTALKNNQELNITMQEIQIARNEVRARKGEYLPFVGVAAGAEVEKVGRYTSQGANDANTEIEDGKIVPDKLPDYAVALEANWELDIWRKLRNAKKSAFMRYMGSVEGKNFLVTNLISEIAHAYFELLALDNQLSIVQRNVQIQSNAFEIVKTQKTAGRVTELAVRRFEAQLLKTRSLQFDIRQKIVIKENEINYLIGRYPQPIPRDAETFTDLVPAIVQTGIPSQLLENRPDVRQAELALKAAKLDVKVAKARFYPQLGIYAGVGVDAYKVSYLTKSPESLIYSIAGELAAPLVNRNAIKAAYYSANSQQIQAIYKYEQTLLNAYIEVANQMAKIDNLGKSYDLISQQVDALTTSVTISNSLFRSARADYMEVLLTQRDALESKFDLIETKMEQMSAMISIYRALGGGWK